MHMNKVIGLLVLLCCELCLSIKVPVVWDESGNSAVKNEPNNQVETIQPQNVQTLQQSKPIPIEYFQYTAQKPQFAVDIAAFHGVKNPQQHYKAYSIKPLTDKEKPVLGIHQMLNEDKTLYHPYQNYVQKTEEIRNHVHPTSTGYEIFHPYIAEEPALQEIYKDPILNKIRNDVHYSKNRLQAYEQEAGKPNIADDEYLESQQNTEAKLFPQKNIPARYEIHRPERRPVYYRPPPRDTHRDHVLNQRYRHPWNQHVKIRPLHYKPLKNHIHHLRQQHGMKYDDERNEYPQIVHAEDITEPQDGYDIYEKGKQKYTQLRNNVDESINKALQNNRPVEYQKLELQKNEASPNKEEHEFVPIKNYAQVRKTETFKHVPRKAAFDDAETYEEILNAPRLREAVKSTKAQTVYSEEGYEDSAYDHAGEQKHASDHEGHGGFLKENEKSGGRYKIPTVLGSYQDGRGSEYRDNIEHGKKWKNNNRDEEEETDSEDYTQDENDEIVDADIYSGKGPDIGNRNKREGETESDDMNTESDDSSNVESAQDRIDTNIDEETGTSILSKYNNISKQHDVDKRETSFTVPEIDLNSTYLTESEILNLAKLKIPQQESNLKDKYPYYFKNIKTINKNSPLRYAENLKLIPRKSDGGTEFYDSRSILECPEVEDDVDPLPEKLKNGENPTEVDDEEDDNNGKGEKKFSTAKKVPRLNGLGDKIDCFKAKYFGENPLDSPFFREGIISNPEPIVPPKLPIFKKIRNKTSVQDYKISNVNDMSKNLKEAASTDIFVLLDKLRNDTDKLKSYINETNNGLYSALLVPHDTLVTNDTNQSNVHTDILANIKNNLQLPSVNWNVPTNLLNLNKKASNGTLNHFQNKGDVTKLSLKLRRKRATPFIYEPYKIIRDSQFQDSKKITTTSNISPLIRQLQSSRVADRVSRSNRDDKQVRPNSNSRTYVDIGRQDRAKSNPAIIDVSIDQRRGEPRYEIKPTNHKTEYSPVENKKSMSIDDYKSRTATETVEQTTANNKNIDTTSIRSRQRGRQRTTVRPFYDVSSFLPKAMDVQNVAASNSVRNTVTTAKPENVSKKMQDFKEENDDDSEENDEEYDEVEDEENEEEVVTTTTTSTPKPTFRRRIRTTTTTEKSQYLNEDDPERLRLVTRFRNYKPSEKSEELADITESPLIRKYKEEDEAPVPKYREKKKKSSKSTLVTDTQKYGDDDADAEDEMRKLEVDAMIGVKENMDDYMPLYEKEEERKQYQSRDNEDDEEEDENEENDDEDEDDDSDDEDGDDEDGDDDDNNESSDSNNSERGKNNEQDEQQEPEVTTPEPTKRTLVRITEAPPPTVASHVSTTSAPIFTRTRRPENKPIVTRKKIEIHKELPVNKSSPNITQFKQDIKEVEIIKEIPTSRRRKPQKKIQPLELYKDDNLAKDINNLGDIEIFSEGIDLDKGPKHGGNYRTATKEDLILLKPELQVSSTKRLKDAEASQSENTKHVELDEYVPQSMHGGNLKSLSDLKRVRNSGKSAKLIELNDPPLRTMHGGNLKYNSRRRGERRNEKLIEFDDDQDDKSSQDDDYKLSPHNSRKDRLHGGNYRSEKLVAENDDDDIQVRKHTQNAKTNAVALLSSFVQAVPVLTTTPGYILDPSKRMYYYVEA